MGPADFYYKRRGMGMTAEEMADLLDVNLRTVRRWETGDFPINDGVAAEVNEMYETFCGLVASTVDGYLELLENLEVEDSPQVVELSTYRGVESHAKAHPGESFTVHKALVTAVGIELAGMGYAVEFRNVVAE